MRRAAWLGLCGLGALAGGCTQSPQNVVMRGSADGVIINYYGDVGATLPLARQHCAQYERVPVLHETKESNAVYFCVRPGEEPRPATLPQQSLR
ncbi:MAG TPA: hypothetical protein VG308_15345 [Stellaceae bacterium]|jgi:hypothetical protein|nr:hypothetical protein [Stellaceae bacterium]